MHSVEFAKAVALLAKLDMEVASYQDAVSAVPKQKLSAEDVKELGEAGWNFEHEDEEWILFL